jgi:dTDP-N-acetylfucosamine:lipid II N-acetylfucosaminyltransferase
MIATGISNHFNTSFYTAVNLMDIVVPIIPTEYKLAKKINPNLIFAPFTYGCLEDILGVNFDKNVSESKNILVGNSGDSSNNHLDIFIKLSKLNLKDKKVFVPLSYGGSKDYINYIIKKGKELLGSNFFPITSFMSRDEYNEILLSCDTLIFNHIRQQGVGNIITLGYLGAKIYLNKKSPVFEYYKSQEIIIFNTNDLTNKSLDYKLTESDLIQNRKQFLKLYSKKSVQIKVNQLFTILNTIKK